MSAKKQRHIKYLYLKLPEHAETWVNGGTVPLNHARKFLSDVREGTRTPDEVLQKSIRGAGLRDLAGVEFRGTGTIENVTFDNCRFNGQLVSHAVYNQHPEDALILCMSNRYDKQLMHRLGHTVAVAIPDVGRLREALDHVVGVIADYGKVRYTHEPGNRSHMLKGIEDSWQDEYRFVWVGNGLGLEDKIVTLPGGLAEHVTGDTQA